MTAVLLISGGVAAVIVALALILPCPACKLRRERLRQATARWRAAQTKRNLN